MTVHSTQLGANEAVGTTEVTIYTVPANIRTIVKGLQLVNNSGSANFIALELYSGSTLLGYWREYMGAAGASGDSITKEIWMVMNAGQTFKAVCHAVSISVILSGSELVL